MFVYEKRLQYPIKIKQTNPKLAKIIITQYGGAYFKCYDYYFLVIKNNSLGMRCCTKVKVPTTVTTPLWEYNVAILIGSIINVSSKEIESFNFSFFYWF